MGEGINWTLKNKKVHMITQVLQMINQKTPELKHGEKTYSLLMIIVIYRNLL